MQNGTTALLLVGYILLVLGIAISLSGQLESQALQKRAL